MKILVIRGKNIASLAGDFEVDFTKEPLSSAGIFAITGNTGAGKSTLLDAMCLALYNTSPRTDKADRQSKLTDVDDVVIMENDCRNLLRRGAAEGYAEVEFKALDGKIYRANWSVKRAHNKSNGRLQATECSLYSISENIKIPLSKKEYSTRVTELTGLTYEQFTRAVMLAQGEFAAFLKALPKEKAEILEKLTGTEIYSRISTNIYKRHKECDDEIKLLTEKIKGVVLLTEDEKKKLTEGKAELDKELNCTEEQNKLLENKRAWIEQNKSLTENLNKAVEEERIANENLAAARERFIKIALIDSVQEIRDTYIAALQAHKSRPHYIKQLQDENECYSKLEEALAAAQREVAEKTEEQERLNNEWQKMQPLIGKARAIEADCNNIVQKIGEIASDTDKATKALDTLCKESTRLVAAIADDDAKMKAVEEWFTTHRLYSTIVPKSDMVIANIKDIAATSKSIAAREKLLTEAEKLLADEEKSLARKEAEAEKLAGMLPEEIAALRRQLVEGEPCPVCGSREHTASVIEERTLKEEELIKAKQKIRKKIENIRKSIEENRSSISNHKAYIENLKESVGRCKERNNEILKPLDGEVKSFGETFIGTLQEIAETWNRYTRVQSETTAAIAVAKAKLEAAEARKEEIRKEIEKSEKAVAHYRNELNKKKEEIKGLIGEDKSAVEIEKFFGERIAQINTAVTTAIEKRNEINAGREKSRGSIAQLAKTIENIESSLSAATKKVEEFLRKREDGITAEQLHELLTISSEEVTRMRTDAEELRNRQLKAETTLKERSSAMEKHRQSPYKTSGNEDEIYIKESIASLAAKRKELLDKISDASSRLRLNEENRRVHAHYLKEIEEKEKVLEKWSILNDTFGSAAGDKFKIIAQGYTLDILLEYANIHLKEISNRYRLARTGIDSLGIKVIDADIMDEERSVHSLSGGETFLVSLALALALSSLSSNRMSIESLFIDEGFGALDNETLRTAMEALEKLQGQGRKVGVISHLQEIIERIPVKIRVIKEREGRSRIDIKAL